MAEQVVSEQINERGVSYQSPERKGIACLAEFLSSHAMQLLCLSCRIVPACQIPKIPSSNDNCSSWYLLQFQYLPFHAEKSLLYHRNFPPLFLLPFLKPAKHYFPSSLGKSMNVSVGSSRVSRPMIQA